MGHSILLCRRRVISVLTSVSRPVQYTHLDTGLLATFFRYGYSKWMVDSYPIHDPLNIFQNSAGSFCILVGPKPSVIHSRGNICEKGRFGKDRSWRRTTKLSGQVVHLSFDPRFAPLISEAISPIAILISACCSSRSCYAT